ncbi:MAG: hypothetical protein AAFR37_07085 [Cyanobacteria bacterium J06628_3]
MQDATSEQKDTLFRLCYQLTNMYLSINLVRLGERTGDMIILAGNDLEIAINPQGKAEYL